MAFDLLFLTLMFSSDFEDVRTGYRVIVAMYARGSQSVIDPQVSLLSSSSVDINHSQETCLGIWKI